MQQKGACDWENWERVWMEKFWNLLNLTIKSFEEESEESREALPISLLNLR